jgi:hypothetical protein
MRKGKRRRITVGVAFEVGRSVLVGGAVEPAVGLRTVGAFLQVPHAN